MRELTPGKKLSEGAITFTPEAKKVFELAVRESRRLNHERVATEHLLLGLTNLRTGRAVRILAALGTGPEAVRRILSESMNAPVGQPAIDRGPDSFEIVAPVEEWVRIRPSEDVLRLLTIAAGRASDAGRSELGTVDVLLAFTLQPGPAVAAGLRLTFDEDRAVAERDRAWTSASPRGERHLRVTASPGVRGLVMTAGGGALIRGSSLIELTDLLLALIVDESNAAMFERIALDRFRTKNSLEREHALAQRDIA